MKMRLEDAYQPGQTNSLAHEPEPIKNIDDLQLRWAWIYSSDPAVGKRRETFNLWPKEGQVFKFVSFTVTSTDLKSHH